ncbi:MAG: tetratricopeptide repeat protein [Caldithrix sp.]|nr:tetratricopeptide repeat protein [Caldithrix sp.]
MNRQQPTMEDMQRIEELKQIVTDSPEDFEAIIQLANNYFDVDDYNQAINYYQQALELEREHPNVLIDIGVAYFNMNNPDSALAYVEEALQVEPHHKQGLYNVGIIYYNMGQTKQAIDHWEELISLHGSTVEARNAREFIEELKKRMNQS